MTDQGWANLRGHVVLQEQGNPADATQRDNLEAFIVRARRVEGHSLVRDSDLLARLATASFQLKYANGRFEMRHVLPSEELMESAAARVRPILLKGEDCYYNNALKAIGYFVRDDTVTARLKQLRAGWRKRVEEGVDGRESGYRVMVRDASSGVQGEMDDVQLAHAWIYGDVVHHDRKRRSTSDPFGLQERFRAAVPLIAWTIGATIGLLQYIRWLNAAGKLEISSAALDQPVILETTTFVQEGKVYMAPPGTAPPTDVTMPFSENWVEMTATRLRDENR